MTETTSGEAQTSAVATGDSQPSAETAAAGGQPAAGLQTPAPAEGTSAINAAAPSTASSAPAAPTPAPPVAPGLANVQQGAPNKAVPSLGRIVIARYPHRQDAPGIVTFVHSDTVVDLQIFRGDHLPHNGQNVAQIEPTNTDGTGWFWPPRV